MFGVGNIFMLMAASAAGNAIAFSFAQLGVIISTIGGILFLGEKKTKKELATFLWTRGLWLILLEILVNNLIWTFDITYSLMIF